MSYVEMHARSAFSFLEAASLPEELTAAAAALDMPAVALLDRNGVYGAPRFHKSATRAGIRAHIGSELVLSLPEASITCALPVLIATRAGYQNLCRLVTRMKLRSEKGGGVTTLDELVEFAGGMICMTGGDDGPISRLLAADRTGALVETVTERLIHVLGRGNVYCELQRHYDRREEARNQVVIDIARRLGLPLIATNGVTHVTRGQRELLDVLTCIRHKTRINVAGRLLARNAERHFKSAREMAALFADLPDAVANTNELSSRLGFTLDDLGYRFPAYPVPPGETMNSFLRKRTFEGARSRYRKPAEFERAGRQIERELALIQKLELAGYFLIVWDIVEFCRRSGILVQGRGSAANSAVCYSLGITAVDPVGMELLFERFLSEERGEWPDIDLDLPSGDQRERAIQYVYERYGKLGAAMTANVITYRGRLAAREVGKVLGFDEATAGRLSSLAGVWGFKDPDETCERQFRDAGLDIEDARVGKFQQLYREIQNLPRHLGQHSGGMVICQGQLDQVVPLEPATMPGRVVVQWDKDDCADLGIIKVDLLGLGMMAALEESIQLIRDHYDEEVDLAHLPQDDPAVYAALQKADTIGLFQVESRAQMSCLPRLRPIRFYDIVVQVAIIRPGPIVGEMLHPYLRRRQGKEKPDCLHPSLEPVLRRTLGVPLFQEQLLRIAMICAGFSGGEAEELRRAFGFKRSEAAMADIEVKLRAGMQRNGIAGETQDRIVKAITSFALYGFPESHAASFALIAYASAYLKCHYLGAFTCALLNNQPMGFYDPFTLIKDAQRHGLRVLPVDATRSEWNCTLERVEGRPDWIALRLGMRYVKGLREEVARAILSEREVAPFTSITDMQDRVPELRRDELRRLARIGALNFIPDPDARSTEGTREPRQWTHRRDALWQGERLARPAGPLLGALEEDNRASPLLPMNPIERVNADIGGTGVTVGRHPLAHFRSQMESMGVIRAAHLRHLSDGTPVRIAGCVICRQRPGTAKGFFFLSLEDETGIANAIVTPDLFADARAVLVNEAYLVLDGVLQNLDNVVSVRARAVQPLRVRAAATESHNFR